MTIELLQNIGMIIGGIAAIALPISAIIIVARTPAKPTCKICNAELKHWDKERVRIPLCPNGHVVPTVNGFAV